VTFAGGKLLGEVAKDFVELKLAKVYGVLGVLLVGSSSIGYADKYSDVDLEVFVTQESFSRLRGAYEAYESFRGTDISWEWMTLKELEDALRNWRNDVDLWVYSKSTILLDRRGRLESLLARYRRYPKKVWLEKLFVYWYYATGNAPYDSGKALQRKDFTIAQLYLTQAMEYYTALIFILNKSFVPYRKWRLREMEKLNYKPTGYIQMLRNILKTAEWTNKQFEAKQEIINNLVSELKGELMEAGVMAEKLENPWKFKVGNVPRI
jgi:predicted nucleotidyltransferase